MALIPRHNVDPASLVAPKVKKPRIRKRKSLRALYRALLGNLRIEDIKRPWMATKSFRLLDTEAELAKWVDSVLADPSLWIAPYSTQDPCPVIAVDTETMGLDTRIIHIEEQRRSGGTKVRHPDGSAPWAATYEVKNEIAGICLSADDITGVYIPITHTNGKNVSRELVQYHLQRLFDVSHLVFYNAKFDREVLRLTCGIEFRPYPHYEDVQVLHYINDPKADLKDDMFSGDAGGLKALSKEHLGIDQIDLGSIGKVKAEWCTRINGPDCDCNESERKEYKHSDRVQYVPFSWIPTDIAVWYAAADAICTWSLWAKMRGEAQSRARAHAIDGELIDSLAWIERQRYIIAEEPHARMVRWHVRQMSERRDNLCNLALEMGWIEKTADDGSVLETSRFSVDSPKNLSEFLFNIRGFAVTKRSDKTDEPSTDKEALSDLIKMYPEDRFLKALIEYRKYVALHPENLRYDPADQSARIYLKQCVVAGGRLAASGGKFERDGGFGLNVQAIKKVGGNWFVKGRVLVPDFVPEEEVEPHEEHELDPSCFREIEEERTIGWRETCVVDGVEVHSMHPEQFPSDIEQVQMVEDAEGDWVPTQRYADDAPERHRMVVTEKTKVRTKAAGILRNHIANFLGYSICLVPGCTSCRIRHGILIERGKLDANQVLNLRALFVARPGWTFLTTDYSNIEVRVASNVSGDPEIQKIFLFGDGDHHSLTASKVFPEYNDPNISKDLRKMLRALAKIINFALQYGGTEKTIYESMRKIQPSITLKDTRRMVDAYWAGVPAYREFCDRMQKIALEEMTCTTAFGRVIKFESAMKAKKITRPIKAHWDEYWRHWRIGQEQKKALADGRTEEAEVLRRVMDEAWQDPSTGIRNVRDYRMFLSKIQRVSMNVPLQGLAGDFMRMAINRVRKWATTIEPDVQSVLRMHGSVHDELDYCVKNEYLPFVVPRVTRLMKLRKLHAKRGWPVPIECDTEYGMSWDVQQHLTGDDSHLPAGWTEIPGLEQYLPPYVSLDTVDALSRSILAGGLVRASDWAARELHPRAQSAFRQALYTLDKEKKEHPRTNPADIRKQVIAALQLDEYWRIDETPDDAGLEMETLAEFEARAGLTTRDRGYMPKGGFLGALPIREVLRPEVPHLGVEDELRAPPEPPRNEALQSTLLFSPTEPEEVRCQEMTPQASIQEAPIQEPIQEELIQGVPALLCVPPDAAATAEPKPPSATTPKPILADVDPGLDEMLGPPPSRILSGVASRPFGPKIGRRNPDGQLRSKSTPENLPEIGDLSNERWEDFLQIAGVGFGSHTLRFRLGGVEKILENTMIANLPEQFWSKSEVRI